MHCHGCGAEVVEQAAFCHKCGARLDEGRPDSPSPEADPPQQAASPPTAADAFKQAIGATRADRDEEEVEMWRGGYSPKAMIGSWLLCGLITLVLIIGGVVLAKGGLVWGIIAAVILATWLYFGLVLCHRRLNVRYKLTNQRFMHESGILRRVTDRIETIDMDDITFEQTFLERFVGVGTVRITSTDRSHPELILIGIDNVKEVAGQLDDIRRGERRSRGLHIENI